MEEKSVQQDLSGTIGACGKFQVTLTLLMQVTQICGAWSMIFMVFGMYNPGWTCLDNRILNTSSASNTTSGDMYSSHRTDPYISTTPQFSTRQDNLDSPEWTLSCSEIHECQDIMYNEDSSTIVTEWSLSCDLAWIPSVIITIEMVGTLVGSYISGQMGDKYGRKVTVYANVGLLVIAHVVAVFSVSWQMYASVLFVLGVAVGGVISSTYHYPLEFVSEWWRGILTSLPTWNVAAMTFAALVFLLRDWRHVHITAAALTAVVFLTVFWSPDSVRWMAVNGKTEQAKGAIAKIAKMNGRPCPDTQIIDEIATEEKNRMRGYNYTYLDLFRMRSIRGYSIKFGLIWVFMAIGYYTISFGIKSLSGSFYLNLFISSIFELPGMLFVAPAVNKLGRRRAAVVYFCLEVIIAFSAVIVSFTTSGNVKDMAILVLALTSKMLTVGVWAVIAVFSTELYPTVVRSLHMGYLNAVSRIGVMIAPYIIPNDPNNIYVAFVVIGCIMFVNMCLAWSLPESKGRPLVDSVYVNVHEDGNNQELKPMQSTHERV